MEKHIDNEEYLELSRSLINAHTLFYKMWELGRPNFTTDIDTAAVSFDEEGENILFSFNPDYWDKLSKYERQFVISHECLHVILNHGYRIVNSKYKKFANIAADIVVNHMLVNKFGFIRDNISMAKNMCWVDTIWPDKKDITDNNSFEYYYNLLVETGTIIEVYFPDEHGNLKFPSAMNEKGDGVPGIGKEDGDGKGDGKLPEKFVEKLNKELDDETKKSITGIGTEAGGLALTMSVEKVHKKKKWETIIKKWSRQFTKSSFQEVEQWARVNRRFAMISKDIILPTEMEVEKNEDDKINVWFFQDTSGSCYGYSKRFFDAAKSLDPKKFKIRLFCFDTRVYETSLETGKLYGFGGTAFHIIENHIQKEIREKKIKYPKAVFVITDGYGTNVSPTEPKKWYWFLTPFGSIHNIPSGCNIYKLQDFE